MSLRGRLHLAPLREETLKHALDFGTGTGIWAMEFGKKERIPSLEHAIINYNSREAPGLQGDRK